MNNTDKIITYLSGEMEQAEADQFDLLRAADPELEHAFQAIRKIWELTRENLMLEDLPEENIRDQLIAEVMAHHDIDRYRNHDSKKMMAFRKALEKAAESAEEPGKKHVSRSRYNLPTILLAAASLVLLFLVLRPATSLRELAVSYYDPAGSELASGHAFKTRSNEAQALQFIRDRNYQAARHYFESDLNAIADDPVARLFYGISCHETGDSEQAIAVLRSVATADTAGQEERAGQTDTVSYHAKWYLSLILIREGKTEEALPFLIELSRTDGPFNSKSTRLLRKTE
jgi:tetratricopeptide (TPR) repeat protein